MNAAKSIATLYTVISRERGAIEAKIFVSDVVFNIISELQENNQPVTEKAIADRLAAKAHDYSLASKNLALTA